MKRGVHGEEIIAEDELIKCNRLRRDEIKDHAAALAVKDGTIELLLEILLHNAMRQEQEVSDIRARLEEARWAVALLIMEANQEGQQAIPVWRRGMQILLQVLRDPHSLSPFSVEF